MSIPKQFIDDLNRDADIVEIIGRYVKLQRKGNSYMGLCPFHDEKTPSFSVTPGDRNFYHCFGCGVSGNTLRFLMERQHGGDFLAAVEDLARQLGREIPRDSDGPPRPRLPLELLDKMRDHYQKELFKRKLPREYLKERGLSKKTALDFQLGFAPRDGGFAKAFGDVKKVESALVKLGLAKRSTKEGSNDIWPYFRNRVMFPILSTSNKTVGFGGRIMGDGEPKYLNSPQSDVFNKGRIVYRLAQATPHFKAEGHALVVEGYMDVVMLAEHGLGNAVATMGTAATSEQLAAVIMRADSVVFCFDGDEAGRRAAAKVIANAMPVLKDGKSLRFALLADGDDPDSYVRSKGADGMRKMLSEAQPLEELLLDPGFIGTADAEDAAGHSELWRRAIELIEKIDRKKAPLFHAELYKRLADKSGIAVDDLKDAARSLRRDPPPPSEPPYEQDPPWEHATDMPPYEGTEPRQRGTAVDVRMKEHWVYKLLVILCAHPQFAADVKGLPLHCGFAARKSLRSPQDVKLCEEVIEELAQGKGAKSVQDLLRQKNRLKLVAQLEKTVADKGGTAEQLKSELEKISATMKGEEGKLEAQRRRLAQTGKGSPAS